MREHRIGRLNGRFVVTWQDGGTRRRYRLDALTAKDAEREARDLILRRTAPQAGITVAQVWTAYQNACAGRRMGAHLAQTGRIVLPHFGALGAEQVTTADCRAFIAARREQGRKDYTIWTELGHLRSALRWGVKQRLTKHAPHIERPPTPAPRDRYLTRDEVSALLAAPMDPHIRLTILLIMTTAARITAALELTWRRVDLDRGVIQLGTSDIGPRKGRATVPINDTLRAALEQAQAAALSDHVIEWAGKPVRSIKTGWGRALTASGIDHCTLHDLRRTAGRFMAEAGVPIEEIASYLGHSNPNLTRSTYAQFSPEYLRRASRALEFNAPCEVQQTRKRPPKSS